jgi:hypothetical protein
MRAVQHQHGLRPVRDRYEVLLEWAHRNRGVSASADRARSPECPSTLVPRPMGHGQPQAPDNVRVFRGVGRGRASIPALLRARARGEPNLN